MQLCAGGQVTSTILELVLSTKELMVLLCECFAQAVRSDLCYDAVLNLSSGMHTRTKGIMSLDHR